MSREQPLPQFDAVAYTRDTRGLVLPFLIQLDPEEKKRRGVKLGLTRTMVHAPFRNARMVRRSLLGAVALVPEDFTWTPLFPELKLKLSGGVLNPGALERIAPEAESDRKREAAVQAAQEQHRAERSAENQQIVRGLMLAHLQGVLKLAGVKKAKKKAIKNFDALLDAVKARAGSAEPCALAQLLCRRWHEILEQGIEAPKEVPPELLADWDSFLDQVLAEGQRAIKGRS